MTLSAFLDFLDHSRRSGRSWVARCPAHADRSPSLSISEGDDGRVLLRCFSGCTASEITATLGLSLRDLFPDGKPDRNAIREAEKRRENAKLMNRVSGRKAALRLKAEKVLMAATGVDISEWSNDRLDDAMESIGAAYQILLSEQLEEYRADERI